MFKQWSDRTISLSPIEQNVGLESFQHLKKCLPFLKYIAIAINKEYFTAEKKENSKEYFRRLNCIAF